MFVSPQKETFSKRKDDTPIQAKHMREANMKRHLTILLLLWFGVAGCRKTSTFDKGEFDRLATESLDLIALCTTARDLQFAYEQVEKYEEKVGAFEAKLSKEDRQRKEVILLRQGTKHLKSAILLGMGSTTLRATQYYQDVWAASEYFWKAMGTPDSAIAKSRPSFIK